MSEKETELKLREIVAYANSNPEYHAKVVALLEVVANKMGYELVRTLH